MTSDDGDGDGRGVPGLRAGREGRRPDLPERKPGTPSTRYSPEAKAEILRDLEVSGLGLVAFCREHGLNTKSVCSWRKAYAEHGDAGLLPRDNRRNLGGRSGRVVPADERRALLEAFFALKLPRAVFAKQYGVSLGTLSRWIRAYEEHGPKGLEPKPRGRKPGSGSKPVLPAPVREQVLTTKRRFPSFGMRKIRDYLKRFFGIKVSAGGVASTLKREGIEPLEVKKKRKRGTDRIRRFERARPSELWQTDITSFVLTRHSTRVYLVVFLDDHSRYVVAWGLTTRASAAWVCEVVMEGVARFGKPKEILSDQGPQYFAWRGKSAFQKLLDREGIRHVVARAHHPQTVGKCERLWETVSREFWERAKPQDLTDARARMAHFFNHYNHFRPHQGLDGALPADRFFGAHDALRATLEEQQTLGELELALHESPRKPVYLMGQVGEHKVSLSAQDGQIRFLTEQGLIEQMGLDQVGVSPPIEPKRVEHKTKENHDEGQRARRDPESGDGGRDAAARAPDAQAALSEHAAPGDRGEGPAGCGESGGDPEGARSVRIDPGAVAGQDQQAADRTLAGAGAAAGLAVESASAVGNDRGPVGPTADPDADARRHGSGGDRARIAGPGPDCATQRDREAEAGLGRESASERAAQAIPADDPPARGDATCAAHDEVPSHATQAEPAAPASQQASAGGSAGGCFTSRGDGSST